MSREGVTILGRRLTIFRNILSPTLALAALLVCAHPAQAISLEPNSTYLFLRYFPSHNEPDWIVGRQPGVARWEMGGQTRIRLLEVDSIALVLEASPAVHFLVPWPDGVESDHGGRADLLTVDGRLFLRWRVVELGYVIHQVFSLDHKHELGNGRYWNGIELRVILW